MTSQIRIVAVRRKRSRLGVCRAAGARRSPSASQIAQTKASDAVTRWSARKYWDTSVRALSPGLDHEPADHALQAAEQEEPDEPRLQRRRQTPGEPEEGQRQQHQRAHDPAEQPVRPFPVEDRLEARERHVGVEQRILRDLLVAVELGRPGGVAHRRQYAHNGLPLGDGQARLGQPRRAAHHHHAEDAARHDPEPRPHRGERPRPPARRGVGGGADRDGGRRCAGLLDRHGTAYT